MIDQFKSNKDINALRIDLLIWVRRRSSWWIFTQYLAVQVNYQFRPNPDAPADWWSIRPFGWIVNGSIRSVGPRNCHSKLTCVSEVTKPPPKKGRIIDTWANDKLFPSLVKSLPLCGYDINYSCDRLGPFGVVYKCARFYDNELLISRKHAIALKQSTLCDWQLMVCRGGLTQIWVDGNQRVRDASRWARDSFAKQFQLLSK